MERYPWVHIPQLCATLMIDEHATCCSCYCFTGRTRRPRGKTRELSPSWGSSWGKTRRTEDSSKTVYGQINKECRVGELLVMQYPWLWIVLWDSGLDKWEWTPLIRARWVWIHLQAQWHRCSNVHGLLPPQRYCVAMFATQHWDLQCPGKNKTGFNKGGHRNMTPHRSRGGVKHRMCNVW